MKAKWDILNRVDFPITWEIKSKLGKIDNGSKLYWEIWGILGKTGETQGSFGSPKI